MADVTINNLTGQAPTDSDVFPFSTTGVTPSTYKATLAQIKTALAIPAAQVNSDWNATSGVAQILNKPTIPLPSSPFNGIAIFYNTPGYTTGNFSWTVPSGITKIKVTAVGAGGGGSNGSGTGGSSTFTIGGVTITGGGGFGGGTSVHGNGGSASGGDVNIGGFTRGPGGGYPNNQYGSFYALGGTGNGMFGFGAGGSPVGGGWAGGCGGIAIKIYTVTPGQVASIVTGAEGGGGWQAGARGAVLVEW